ncbi:hypothetical protein K502DRAFT_288547 [Neoconidiobolus thromboides FSU 785]|nr:hypothetical protein K502DRAFT_288547 [Neoconidiobolus thromboides FSU 785]
MSEVKSGVPEETKKNEKGNIKEEKEVNEKTVTANNLSQPQIIVEEFQYLLEKSQQLFAGLRELSPVSGRQWQTHFQRTFEIYTKLWKFQQIHRVVLEDKEYYGLKRWEVGEIASKIGQIYYHYYLRTSETNYLYESYVFYEAIHERNYFKDVLDAKNPAQMIKKLRYYARFIVVGLLLLRKERVAKLYQELSSLVEDYTKLFKPVDSMEWQMVLQEIITFLEVEKKILPLAEGTAQALPIQFRFPNINRIAIDTMDITGLRLQEVIIVGNKVSQVKFSELSLDMYRMVLTLEREPQHVSKSTTTANPESTLDENDLNKKSNELKNKPNFIRLPTSNLKKVHPPHKYLLFRPTFSQLLVYISNCYKDLSDNSALLIYLSSDAIKSIPSEKSTQYGYVGGCATSYRKPMDKASDIADSIAASHCLHPGDLIPFTRKPLFLIVESNSNDSFKKMPNLFNQPFLCLMAPIDSPFKDSAMAGSIMTMFLSSPLVAFCYIADLVELSPEIWTKMTEHFTYLEEKCIELLLNTGSLDATTKSFMYDDFLKLLIARFILATIIMGLHRLIKDSKNLPTSLPSFPSSIFSSNELISKLRSVIELTGTSLIFSYLDKTSQPCTPSPLMTHGDSYLTIHPSSTTEPIPPKSA